MLARARRALVVGDPEQLQLVDNLDDGDRVISGRWLIGFDHLRERLAKSNSLWDLARLVVDDRNVHFLSDHYRCTPQIASWVNRHFYDDRMVLRTQGATRDGMHWIDVSAGSSVGRHNSGEVAVVRDMVCRLIASGSRAEDIGVIAPFSDQVAQIRRCLQAPEIKVGTVHSFQGSERETIIWSLVLGAGEPPGRTDFVDDRKLVNVAMTRARRRLFVVGDHAAFASKETSPLGLLAAHLPPSRLDDLVLL